MGEIDTGGLGARVGELVIATLAAAAPMGAQVYEDEISRRAASALRATGEDWSVRRLVARSLRSPLAGNRRLPLGTVETAGRSLRRLAGRFIYPRDVLVHRMGLSLPPAATEVVTLHDTVAWRYPDEGTAPASAGDELRAARAVVCVSRFAADDIAERFGIDPVVIHNGVDPRFAHAAPLDSAELASLGIHGRFILHAGGASMRKNLPALAEAWIDIARAAPDVSLVLCGPPHSRRTELFSGLPRTILAGRVDDARMPGLMAAAAAVVVPSLDEGFGLPVLEAMAAGSLVVAANTSSLPEAAGDAAVLVEPNASALAEATIAVLERDVDVEGMKARGRLRAADFTWERCAAEHAAVWCRAVAV